MKLLKIIFPLLLFFIPLLLGCTVSEIFDVFCFSWNFNLIFPYYRRFLEKNTAFLPKLATFLPKNRKIPQILSLDLQKYLILGFVHVESQEIDNSLDFDLRSSKNTFSQANFMLRAQMNAQFASEMLQIDQNTTKTRHFCQNSRHFCQRSKNPQILKIP